MDIDFYAPEKWRCCHVGRLEYVNRLLNEIKNDKAFSLKFQSYDSLPFYIFESNKTENIIPSQLFFQKKSKLLEKIANTNEYDISDKLSVQFAQHVQAYRYLMSHASEKLSSFHIIETHRILLNGIFPTAGKIRDVGMMEVESDWVFPPGDPKLLLKALDGIVDEYNKQIEGERIDNTIVRVPSDLFYDIVQLHPFVHFNGIMARLLFSFALYQLGLPVPVVLSSGSRAHRCHIATIRSARHGNKHELYDMAFNNIYHAIKSREETIRS